MLASWAVAFGLLAGLLAWRGSASTGDAYRALAQEGARSVDAALTARGAALDHMGAVATFLESGGDARYRAEAERSWHEYTEASRVSWENRTDEVHGEHAAFQAADAAARTYSEQIGAVYGFLAAGQADRAQTTFLAARDTMNTGLVPALSGLEAVKVEGMEEAYAGTKSRLDRWRLALLAGAALAMLGLLTGLLAVRRMRYRWSWPVGLALLGIAALTFWIQRDLQRAVADSRVLVREAYEGVAGTEDLEALVSQGRALESIAVFDRRPGQAAGHLADFAEYGALIEQKLCGPVNCTQSSFVDAGGRLDPGVVARAIAEAEKLGLPKSPLIANAPFEGQPGTYEKVRQAYTAWLTEHGRLEKALAGGQVAEAARISRGQAAETFERLESEVETAAAVPRREFEALRDRGYSASSLGSALSVAFPIAGLAAAAGLLRRRRELFVRA